MKLTVFVVRSGGAVDQRLKAGPGLGPWTAQCQMGKMGAHNIVIIAQE